jgi:hypothetical protein
MLIVPVSVIRPEPRLNSSTTCKAFTLNELQAKLDHIGEERLRQAVARSADLTIIPGSKRSPCTACRQAKLKTSPIHAGPQERSNPWRMDPFRRLWTPSCRIFGRKKYFVSFIDDAISCGYSLCTCPCYTRRAKYRTSSRSFWSLSPKIIMYVNSFRIMKGNMS